MADAGQDYDRLKRFMALASEAVFGIAATADVHPLRSLKAMEARSRAKAAQGLRMAVNDLVEATAGLSAADVARWDATLAASDAATLSEVRARFGKALRSVVRRGAIRTEAEYFLVRNAADTAAGTEAERLWSLLGAYELRETARG